MPCLWSPIAIVRMLDTSRGLYGPCSWHWGILSPCFSLVSQGCFMGTHTFGVCMWQSTRGQWPIIFAASITWSRLPHRGGHSRKAWERPHEKLCHCYDMKWRNKWSNRSITTSQAASEKELELWWCPREIVTTSVLRRPSEADSSFGPRSWWGHQGG
jgi:hypothetical protein